ncbi:hypothetical protein JNM87_01775 [Candidatus Saccharibacteria bacterium]|nr:hypothetical protein [Candidatus Saccharibacteria bacterium]
MPQHRLVFETGTTLYLNSVAELSFPWPDNPIEAIACITLINSGYCPEAVEYHAGTQARIIEARLASVNPHNDPEDLRRIVEQFVFPFTVSFFAST